MSGRRSDTRDRIQQIALELFAEQGYENTSLREVADRLGITRPALYYHYKTKEDILVGVVEDLIRSIDELLDWARAQPRTQDARMAVLRRITDLLSTRWRPLIKFSQTNQRFLDTHPIGDQLRNRMLTMVSVLSGPEDTLVRQFEARLAVLAVVIGSVPALFDLDVTDEQRNAVALEVATKLLREA
ncbi:TetR/AcrR family transcriptional regulator [Goodfellowiella coeruleoviolacea]|uniref:Transcriptional regulator, TetR family n=1 Tax=Goodfellowiella coeruleoviolacea TaxID=334858 RepID=A0AAE3KGZ1_9PSEU|nr:TetR/AcrR family transcriptional regulator [Goodfellowiella coeruleoviolacea]MCP2166745.1 transcriptional regulator, TetR family [Goodfellowiella coeruleoviolacea]